MTRYHDKLADYGWQALERALEGITVPTLCVSGTKDTFGTPQELKRHFGKVKGEVTWTFLEGKGHDLKNSDPAIVSAVREWLGLRPAG